jgi:hypothetical protein
MDKKEKIVVTVFAVLSCVIILSVFFFTSWFSSHSTQAGRTLAQQQRLDCMEEGIDLVAFEEYSFSNSQEAALSMTVVYGNTTFRPADNRCNFDLFLNASSKCFLGPQKNVLLEANETHCSFSQVGSEIVRPSSKPLGMDWVSSWLFFVAPILFFVLVVGGIEYKLREKQGSRPPKYLAFLAVIACLLVLWVLFLLHYLL